MTGVDTPRGVVDDSAAHDAAVAEIVWLMTKAGPFGSPAERAANLLDRLGTRGSAAHTYLDTLARAKQYVDDNIHEGVICPCCGQTAHLYRRALNAGMARALILLHRACPDAPYDQQWLYKPDVLRGVGAAARDESLLRFWGLLEDSQERRADGGKAGWWRVTNDGHSFARGNLRVPRYVTVYNGQSHGLEGPDIDVRDALGHRFNYDDLMRGVCHGHQCTRAGAHPDSGGGAVRGGGRCQDHPHQPYGHRRFGARAVHLRRVVPHAGLVHAA